ALEAVDGDAGAGGLALAAAAGGLALARADAASDADAGLAGAGIIGELVQSHLGKPSAGASAPVQFAGSTFSLCATLRTMPRIDGVSSTTFERFILFSPSAFKVSRCPGLREIGLPIWVSFSFAIYPTPGRRLRRACRGCRSPSWSGARQPCAASCNAGAH